MFKRHLWPAIQWICCTVSCIWCYLARPFRRRSYSTELPLASPAVPSTPSFIQTQEPSFPIDAMRIFHLNDGLASTSHLTRNKLAIHQMRTAPPDMTRIASLSSTDPSPGFSLLTDVVDNLVTLDSPSLHSSPPSSPSSSLNTPCIIVSSPLGDIIPRHAESLSPDFRLQREPRISEPDSPSQGESPLYQDEPAEVSGLAKRRNFKGAPIITGAFPTVRLSRGSVTPTDWRMQQTLSLPESAFAAVTDFVRGSTNIPSRNVSRKALGAPPESQAAYTQSSPFSVQAESFFVDDHLSRHPGFDIHDLGIYTDPDSTLNLHVPRRKRTPVASELPFCIATNNYGNTILADGDGEEYCRSSCFSTNTDIPPERTRTASGISHLTEVDISLATIDGVSKSPESMGPSVSSPSSPNFSIRDGDSDSNEQHTTHIVEPVVSSRESLYSSLIFPFSLEDSISWDTGPDIGALDDNGVHNILVLELFSDTASLLDQHCDNLSSPVSVVDTEDDHVQDDAMPFLNQCPVFFPCPTIDKSYVAGSAALGIYTDSLPDIRDTIRFCEEDSDESWNREEPLLQVADVPEGHFSGVLLPVSGETKSSVNDSQAFSSALSAASIDCFTAKNDSLAVNSRRARRMGIYGPLCSLLVTPDPQDNLLMNSEECLDSFPSERQRSSYRRSTLRPLVLPMRVAIRELSTGDRSSERASDTLLQSNRTSIGFPPPHPLPELPPYTSSSTSTIVPSGFSSLEELDAFQKRKTISAKSLEPLLTYSVSELEDPDNEDSTQTINWGVAF